ncbi:heterokaryon incompatibility domain-containing protein [Trichoderma evansii]
MATNATKVPNSSDTDKTPPGHDIFCTPENSHFHSKVSYRALDASRREIRLLVMLPDDGLGLIKCELLHNVLLSEVQGQYFALSYCAGDVHMTRDILVDGVRCIVFANLRHTLAAARHYFKANPEKVKTKDGKFLVWVDQICINQYDLAERSHQVGFMRDIYQCAQQTLICLSTKKSKASGLKWLIDLCDKVPPRDDDDDVTNVLKKEDDANTILESTLKGGTSRQQEIAYERFHWKRLYRYLWKNIADEGFINGWLAFYDVVESPWVTGFKPGGLQDRQMGRIIDRIERTHSDAALDTVNFMARTKVKEVVGSIDLKDLLAHSRHCKASDDRDRIFAFLGLADPRYEITANYATDHSINAVLINTTVSIIRFENKLDTLRYAAFPTLSVRGLPSWVVDWTSKEATSIVHNNTTTWPKGIFHGMRNANANVSYRSFRDSRGIHRTLAPGVSGVFIDDLGFYIRTNSTSGFGDENLFPCFLTQNYLVFTTDQAQCSDQVWVLDGASEAIILRPMDLGYRFISCATVWAKTGVGSITTADKELLKTAGERIWIV